MIIGITQSLPVAASSLRRIDLDDGAGGLLPLRLDSAAGTALPEVQPGEQLDVFVGTDTHGQPYASLSRPSLERHQCGSLRVVDLSPHGAFLDWGLEQDLFLPWAEQRRPRAVGQYETVLVYLDNSNRLAASSRIDHHLSDTPEGFRPWQQVELLIFQRTDLGFKAIIDNRAIGLLYKDEVFSRLRIGERVRGYIRRIREDGRIDLSLQPRAPELTDELGERIIASLAAAGGRLPLGDHSSPETIRDAFGVSKKAFKRALSSLYRERRIIIEADHVRLPD